MDLKLTTRKGEKKIYVQKVIAKANITSFKYKFDESEKEFVQLHQVLSNVIDTNVKDIINAVQPIVEGKLSELLISNFNYFINFNYEKYFPEKA